MKRITIDICCKNPDNGLFQGYVEDVSIEVPGGVDIELTGGRVRVSDNADAKKFRIGRIVVDHYGMREWVGNWCWNSITVDVLAALRILNYLKGRGWVCEDAPSEFSDRWDNPRDITLEEMRTLCDGEQS